MILVHFSPRVRVGRFESRRGAVSLVTIPTAEAAKRSKEGQVVRKHTVMRTRLAPLARRRVMARRTAASAVLLSLAVMGLTVIAPAEAAPVCRVNSAADVKAQYPTVPTAKYDIVFLDGCALDKMFDVSRRGTDLSLWQPKSVVWQAYPAAQGWRLPGDMPVSAPNGSEFVLDPPENYMTFLIKAKNNAVLANPVSFTRVWDNHGTGSRGDITLYEPNCPDGYDALGLASAPYAKHHEDVVNDGNLGLGDNGYGIGCFNRSITYPMEPATTGPYDKGAIWDTKKNMKGSADIAFFAVQRPAGPVTVKDNVVLPPPTFWAKKDTYDPPVLSKFRGIQLPVTGPSITPAALQSPKLTSASVMGLQKQSIPDSHEIPALLVTDDYYGNDLAKFRNSPVYHVEMSTTWVPTKYATLCPKGGAECTISYSAGTNQSESETWNKTVGGSVTVTGSTEFKATAGVVGTGYTLSVALEANFSYQWGGEKVTGTSVDNGTGTTLKPGQFGAYFVTQTTYKIYRKNSTKDEDLVRPAVAAVGGVVSLARYPDDNPTNTDCTKTGLERNLVACPLPTTATASLPRGEQIFSDSGSHYLLLSKGGTLEVREADQGVDQSEGATWYLDKNHEHGTLGHSITSASFIDGRLKVLATGLPDWCTTKDKHPGARLDVGPDGILRVTDATNPKKVFWSSKFDTVKEGGC